MLRRIGSWAIGILITLLYAYTVVAAVGSLTGLPRMGEAMGIAITTTGWFWLWFGAVMPVAIFAFALVIGRRRPAWQRLLVLAAGLCVVAAVQLEVMHLVPQSAFFA